MRVLSFLVVALVVGVFPSDAQDSQEAVRIQAWLVEYETAFNAKDLVRLEAFYHPDVTIFEGGAVNKGWIDYRDNHLGPELLEFENLQFGHRDIHVQMLSSGVAYLTAEYFLKARIKEKLVDAVGLETLVLIKGGNAGWRIRHSHTSSRRRPTAPGE